MGKKIQEFFVGNIYVCITESFNCLYRGWVYDNRITKSTELYVLRGEAIKEAMDIVMEKKNGNKSQFVRQQN